MNLKYFYSLMAGVALVFTASCTPDDHDLSAPDFSPEELVEGTAFSVEVDQSTNKIKMTSLLSDRYQPTWITPQGLSNDKTFEISIPFAGEYEIKYGVRTQGGLVFADPYKFTLNSTNGNLLTDPLWEYLTGGGGNSKTWVMDHKNYDLTSVTFCAPYMGWDKFTDGKTFTEADYPGYADLGLDNPDWTWAAGEPDWMFSQEIFQSMPELTFDLINGANFTIDGVTKSFNFNPETKALTLPAGVKWLSPLVADNFLVDWSNLEVVKLNEHVLGIKAVRDDGKGGMKDQRIVFCYVEKGWDGVWPSSGPSLGTATPVDPSVDNLAEKLFEVNVGDFNVSADQTTLLLNEEAPYDWMWWNPAIKEDGTIAGWEAMNAYGATWAPALEGIDEWALTLEKKGKATLESPAGAATPNFTVQDSKIVFDSPVTFFTAGNVALTGTEFTVFKCSADDAEIILGVPDGTDADGNVNKYLVANCTIKAIGGGQQGPTVIPVDQSKVSLYVEANDHFRIQLYNPWGGEPAVDASKIKLKKNQTMTMKFTLSGVTWKEGAQPKVLFGNNFEALGFEWPSNGAGFDVPSAFDLNKNGETTITLTNTTGSTVAFEGTSVILACIQVKDMVEAPLADNGLLDPEAVKVEVTSLTIE